MPTNAQEKDLTQATILDPGDFVRIVKDLAGTPLSQVISYPILLNGGWISVTDTWTYASASTINVPTNATLTYQKGDFIRFKQGGGYKYGVLYTVAATLLTIMVNTDHVVANAAITDIAYCRSGTPYGWPGFFNYAATVHGAGGTAGSYAEASVVQKYAIHGKSIHTVIHRQITNVGSWTGNVLVLKPVEFVTPAFFSPVGFIVPNAAAPSAFRAILQKNVAADFYFGNAIGSTTLTWAAMAANDWMVIDTVDEY